MTDRHSRLYPGRATRLLAAVEFEQSVKGKKEINSALTNVNKVLSVRQRHIDGIKRANVPLACLSFNYIAGSLRCILPRGQPILHHICVHMSRGSHAWVCVRLYHKHVRAPVCVCVCGLSVFACGQHHFTFIEMSSAPRGPCAELRPAAMLASIDSPGLRLG